jgi:hypothetical protein
MVSKSLLILILSLILFPLTIVITIQDERKFEFASKRVHTPTESEGPTFTFEMPNFADLIPGTEPVNLSLNLAVTVTDPDGVDTVIGSYSNRSDPIWRNVTLHQDLISGTSGYYIGHACNFTLDDEHSGVIWDIKFYANDTLGHWNVSETTFLSFWRPNLPPPSETAHQENLQIFRVILIFAIFVIGAVTTWAISQKKEKR